MSLESELFAALCDDPAVSGLVGTRIYPGVLKQSATLPAIVVSRINTTPDYTQEGRSTLEDGTFQLDCWATTHVEVIALAKALRAAVEGRTTLGVGFVRNALDDREEETGMWRRIVEVWFQYREV